MSRSSNSADMGHSGLMRNTKDGVAERLQAGQGRRRSPFPTPAEAVVAERTTSVGSTPVTAAYVDAAPQFAGVLRQSETDYRSRVQESERALVPSPQAAVRGLAPPVGLSTTTPYDITPQDAYGYAPQSPLNVSAASPTTTGPHRTFSRQSVTSDALESADYHSLSSAALLTTSADELPAVDGASAAGAVTSTRQPHRTSSPNFDWTADAVASPSSPTQLSAGVELPLPAVGVAARPTVSSSSTPSSAVAFVPTVAAAATGPFSARSDLTSSAAPHATPLHPSTFTADRAGGCPSQRGGGSSSYPPATGAGGAGAAPLSQASGFPGSGGREGIYAAGDPGNLLHSHRNDRAASHERSFSYQPLNDAEPVCLTRTASAAEWVLLNVGGRLITTTVATLMADPDSVLASLCACLTRPSLTPPRPQFCQGGPAGETAHRDLAAAAAASPSPLVPLNTGAASGGRRRPANTYSAVGLQRSTGHVGREVDATRGGGGGGDAQSLAAGFGGDAVDDRDDDAESRRGMNVEDGERDGMMIAYDTEEADNTGAAVAAAASATVLVDHNEPTDGDGDLSNPSPDPHVLYPPPRRSPDGPLQLQLQQSNPSSPPPPPHPAQTSQLPLSSPPLPPAEVTAAAGVAGEEGDGEAVNPQKAVSAVPLDVDRYNAILLDLDADYFIPVLNYLRHGAVMIPQHINVDGVLAMAEYLNVAGLVRLLRGPPVPRRVLLFSWGSGGNGELGTHAMRDEATPTMAQVTPFGVRVKEIALGANYSCALTDSGHIYTFGNGEWGQLGLGGGLAGGGRGAAAAAGGGGGAGSGNNNGNVGGLGQDGSGTDVPVELLIPRRIPLFERIPAVHVAAGYAFAMAIVENYHVYFWGNNNHGQSGRGRSFFDPHTKKVDTPVLVETLEGKRIVQLSCGSFFALALSEDGTLYSWGLVDCVGLGTPEEVERHYHAVLGESLSNERRSVVLTPQVVTVKGRRRTGAAAGATPSSLSERIVRIRAGQWHSGAINDRGELFTWGVGYQGRLGHGSKTPSYVPTLVQGALEGQHVVDVACGSFHTVALTSRGAVFCWGDNASGQCGTTANSPDAFTAPYRVVGLEYVAGGVARSIACGRQHTVVVMEGPQPWCGLPCCQVDAGGRAAHSHAQVYCFGEVTRAGGAAGATAAASAVGNSGQSRAAAYGTHGVSMNGLNASTLPGSPGHTPFVTAGMNMAFQPPLAGVAGIYGLRPTLAGTAGHHHPHYQLVTGLQHVDVRAVVSGLHHTFAYVEELMTEVATHASPCQRSATAIHGYVPIYGGAIGGSGGGGAAACYLRGTSAGPMPFYPSDWGFGVGARGGPALPPPPPPSAASPAGVSGAVTGTPTRRFFLPS